MSDQKSEFSDTFEALTGNKPFPWQERLYDEFCNNNIPGRCDIPTGLGKTSVIAIWLLAMARCNGNGGLPRRLVYVVNRRTIVDQATEVVKELNKKLIEAEKGKDRLLYGVANRIKKITPRADSETILGISTLRGEFADNMEWKADPTRPAILVGTVDMIGSKLLFSGYGDSRRVRPLHAGLIGCDTLFVHDEAHLTPAFGQLIREIANTQSEKADSSFIPSMHVLELSATHQDIDGTPFCLDDADYEHDIVNKRLTAKKGLCLHEADKQGKPVRDKIIEIAKDYEGESQRIVVFVCWPDEATKIADEITKILKAAMVERGSGDVAQGKLSKKGQLKKIEEECAKRVSILTGEIRGYERDKLLGEPGMQPFLGKEKANASVFLVATSAGEVGMDLHADHMISDLSTLESMIQRLGRVNRFGDGDAKVDVVCEKDIKAEDPRKVTLDIFQEMTGNDKTNVSPAALSKLLQRPGLADAFSPTPDTIKCTDILIDLWSATSLNALPARPEVAPWLHGIQEHLPDTYIAWREEVSLLASETLSDEDRTRWFAAKSIVSKETLRMPTHRLRKLLRTGKRENTPWVAENAKEPVIVMTAMGDTTCVPLEELANRALHFETVILPSSLGRLDEKGFFNAKEVSPAKDVSSSEAKCVVLERLGEHYRFYSITEALGHWKDKDEDQQDESVQDASSLHSWMTLQKAIKDIEQTEDMRLRKKPLEIQEAEEWQGEEDIRQRWLILLFSKISASGKRKTATVPTVQEHDQAVAKLLLTWAEFFSLPKEIRDALWLAGLYHDVGKIHECWQLAAGHDMSVKGFEPKAKSGPGGLDWRKLGGYRHELGSVLEVEKLDEVIRHPERDLILHLIATHHGWARPHFEENAFPPETDDATRNRISLEVMQRYASLQERFGHWRLAWLESLLRRADAITSQTEEES